MYIFYLLAYNIMNKDNLTRSIQPGITIHDYALEQFNKIMNQSTKPADLLCYYLDHIRNYRGFSEEMLENISKFDDNYKMIIIKEYNIVIKSINDLL